MSETRLRRLHCYLFHLLVFSHYLNKRGFAVATVQCAGALGLPRRCLPFRAAPILQFLVVDGDPHPSDQNFAFQLR